MVVRPKIIQILQLVQSCLIMPFCMDNLFLYSLYQVVYSDVYMLDDEMKWKVLLSMPKTDSHIEFAWVHVNNSINFVGGMMQNHLVTKKMVLSGEVFEFDLDSLVLAPFIRVVGKLDMLISMPVLWPFGKLDECIDKMTTYLFY